MFNRFSPSHGFLDCGSHSGNYPMVSMPEMLDDLDLALAWINDNLVAELKVEDVERCTEPSMWKDVLFLYWN